MIRLLSQHPVARVGACETERKLAGRFLIAVVCVLWAPELKLGPTAPRAFARSDLQFGRSSPSFVGPSFSSGVSAYAAAAQPALQEPSAVQHEPGAAEAEHAAAGEEAHGGGWLDVVARLVNFGILAGTLIYLLRSPIRTYLTERGAQIRSDLVNAAEMKTAAAAQIEEINRKMQALPGELEALRSQGAQETAAEEARIRAAAAAERDRLLEQARREIDLQVKVAERELISHAADLAVGVASERIKKNITDDDQKRLVERYVQQLKS